MMDKEKHLQQSVKDKNVVFFQEMSFLLQVFVTCLTKIYSFFFPFPDFMEFLIYFDLIYLATQSVCDVFFFLMPFLSVFVF